MYESVVHASDFGYNKDIEIVFVLFLPEPVQNNQIFLSALNPNIPVDTSVCAVNRITWS